MRIRHIVLSSSRAHSMETGLQSETFTAKKGPSQMQPTENPKANTTSIRPRPTKPSGIAMIVMGIIFLAFSALPFSAAEGEARPFAMIFGAVWVLVCLGFVVYGVYILVSARPSIGIVYDIEGGTPTGGSNTGNDFDARLRKLEKLKQDQLISEDEYRRKRAEILKDRW